MNQINKPLCATQFGNVGFGDCFIDMDKMVGAIQVTSTFSITETQIATLQTFLKNLISAPIGTRIFPYHNFISVADSSEDLSVTTTDYGSKYITKEGFYDWTFRFLKGGIQLHQEIKKNEGINKYFLFYDNSGVLYGYTTGGVLMGIPVDIFHVNPWKVNTGADKAAFNIRFMINPVYMNGGNLGYIPTAQLGFNMFDVKGLQDVSLQLINLVSNVATILAITKISNINMHDAYASNLARTTAWQARNNFNNPVGISAVADNPLAGGVGGWDITFLSGNFNASDKVYLRGVGANIWTAAPISVVGFEAKDELQIEAPAS